MTRARIIHGDALEVLRTLPSASVHLCVTSPPYIGQRDYDCEGQIGIEDSVDEWLEKLVAIFSEVKRVLHDTGTIWVNIGDGYNSAQSRGRYGDQSMKGCTDHGTKRSTTKGIHPKNLLGTPWKLAFALQESGWIWRSNIPWIKSNPLPSNVTDRPANSHEAIMMFAKSSKYFFDEYKMRTEHRLDHWKINTSPGYVDPDSAEDDHFAQFPIEVPRRCILLGTPDKGICDQCGDMLVHVCMKGEYQDNGGKRKHADTPGAVKSPTSVLRTGTTYQYEDGGYWCPKCDEQDRYLDNGYRPTPAVILDPFSGTGTTGIAALRHGRDFIGIELKKSYVDMSAKRMSEESPLFNQVDIENIASTVVPII